MPYGTRLTPEQVEELLLDYRVGRCTVNELTIIYRVSERTVYRILAEAGAKKRHRPRASRKYTPKVPVEKELQPCGTNAAYARHKRNGEYPCEPCLAAHAAEVAKYQPPKKLGKRCGTKAGYKKHLRHKETPCDKCKKAAAKHRRLQRARKKKRDAKNERSNRQ